MADYLGIAGGPALTAAYDAFNVILDGQGDDR